jgi:ABC-type sugar transport system substrate-binding protein
MDAASRRLSLFLPDPGNEFVRAIAADAKEAARRHGYPLTVQTSENRAVEQIQQIFGAIHAPEKERPDAVLVMPVTDRSLERVARAAVSNGIAWICLHRATGDLEALRREFPSVPIALVSPVQEEIGRIQGRQVLAMFPSGAGILYVHGRTDNQSTTQRANGLKQIIEGTAVRLSDSIDGNWSVVDTDRAVGRWLRLLIAHTQVDVVVCQNDAMAVGALQALRGAARELGRPALADIPVIGCDGLPQLGRRQVDEGQLAATVTLPMPGSVAVLLVADARERGVLPPAQVWLQPQPYPAAPAPRSGGGSARPSAAPSV